jgi:hypothetical protein
MQGPWLQLLHAWLLHALLLHIAPSAARATALSIAPCLLPTAHGVHVLLLHLLLLLLALAHLLHLLRSHHACILWHAPKGSPKCAVAPVWLNALALVLLTAAATAAAEARGVMGWSHPARVIQQALVRSQELV